MYVMYKYNCIIVVFFNFLIVLNVLYNICVSFLFDHHLCAFVKLLFQVISTFSGQQVNIIKASQFKFSIFSVL